MKSFLNRAKICICRVKGVNCIPGQNNNNNNNKEGRKRLLSKHLMEKILNYPGERMRTPAGTQKVRSCCQKTKQHSGFRFLHYSTKCQKTIDNFEGKVVTLEFDIFYVLKYRKYF